MGKNDWITPQKAHGSAEKRLTRKILAGLTAVLLLVIVGYAANATINKPQPVQLSSVPYLLQTGVTAPDFTMKGIDGKIYRLSDYRGKKMVLVEFFSTRCPHCQRSTPYLDALYEVKKDSLEILSINAGDDASEPSTAPAFKETYGVTYPILDDPPGSVVADYKLQGFPTLYLVNREGVIVWAYDGEVTLMVSSILKDSII